MYKAYIDVPVQAMQSDLDIMQRAKVNHHPSIRTIFIAKSRMIIEEEVCRDLSML